MEVTQTPIGDEEDAVWRWAVLRRNTAQSVSPLITDRKQKRGYQGGGMAQGQTGVINLEGWCTSVTLVLGGLATGPSLGSLPARLDKNREPLSQIVTIINNKSIMIAISVEKDRGRHPMSTNSIYTHTSRCAHLQTYTYVTQTHTLICAY